jgi:hypothetical protein
MSRLDYVTIAIVVICLAALGFLVYKTVGLMTTDNVGDETTKVEDSYNLDADTSEYLGGDSLIGEDSIEGDLDDDELGYVDEGSYTGDATSQPESAPATSTTKEERPASSVSKPQTQEYEAPASSSSSGEYLVIAGSFRVKSNAEDQVQKLRQLGYANAEVAMFNRSTYASALVNRFQSIGDANALVNELKTKHGIEAIVQRQRGGS